MQVVADQPWRPWRVAAWLARWRRPATPAPQPLPEPAPAPQPPEGPGGRAAPEGWFSAEQPHMATVVRVELWSAQADRAQAAIAAVMAEMRRIEAKMSVHRPDSWLSRINREAAQQPVPLDDELYTLLARALDLSRLSQGAFDISFASAGALYNYRTGVAPAEAELAPARAAIGHQHLRLDPQARSLRFARPGMRIDLGGLAKGHAVDRAVQLLRQHGIEHAMVSAGGDSHLLGDRRGRPWHIAVRDPRQAGAHVAVLPLQDVAISTSGDYERYFERDGQRHHHVLDPRTGRAAAQVRSVTIVADDGLSAEGLSKAVFVLGAQAGLALVNRLPGVDAVVVDAQGALHWSDGLLAPALNAPAGSAPLSAHLSASLPANQPTPHRHA